MSDCHDLDALQSRLAAWADETFPASDSMSVMRHLRDEVDELWDEHRDSYGPGPMGGIAAMVEEEAADVGLLLLHLADKLGFSLFDAMERKFAVNRGREWQTEANDRGYWGHVKEAGGRAGGVGEAAADDVEPAHPTG